MARTPPKKRAAKTPTIDQVRRLMSEDRLPDAEKQVQRILAIESQHPDALHLQAIIRSRRGDGTAALAVCERLVKMCSAVAPFWNTRGVVLRSLGRQDDALASYEKALAINPNYPEAHKNCGNLFSEAGRLSEALTSYRNAYQANPGDYRAKLAAISLLKRLGRPREALPLWDEVAKAAPGEADAWAQGGGLYFALHRYQEAYDCWCRVIGMSPAREELLADLAMVCNKLGRWSEAQQRAEQALSLNAENAWSQLIYLMITSPVVREDSAAAGTELDLFGKRLSALRAWARGKARRGADLIICLTRLAPFDIAYCPGNHRALLTEYGDFVAEVAARHLPQFPVRNRESASRSRLRLGIASTHICRHSVWDIVLKGLVRHLDRTRFELFFYMLGGDRDAETDWARQIADGWRDASQYGQEPGAWLKVLHEDAPDVMFYPELGMNGLSYLLAATRIAPVQAAGWGHPITSGLATVDLYFSAVQFEPETAQNQYREKLVCLPGTGCCTEYAAEPTTAAPELESLMAGIRGIRFLLPHAPFKLHPAGDDLLVEIAKACPEARFIFMREGMFAAITDTVIGRVRRAFAQAHLNGDAHLFMLPWQRRSTFPRLLELADIYLDWPTFSGYTTAWHAVHSGLPVVTMDGEGMRQRLAAGLLRHIGLTETIATSAGHYVTIATRLAEESQDPGGRKTRRHSIQSAAPRLDNDVGVVRAFEKILIDTLAEKGLSCPLQTKSLHAAIAVDDRAAIAAAADKLPEVIMAQDTATAAVMPDQPAQVPAWTQLDGDLHLHTLRHDYAPVGLLEMIPSAGRVLDVGCFCGGTGRWLKQKFPLCDLTGIEMLAKAAEIAAPAYDRIIVGRFEEVDFGKSDIEPASLDTIITADFLEHLVNPWQALQRLRPLLGRNGALYASIPNARNLHVVANLARGTWLYEGAGIQDVTHLRFFTRASLMQMLRETGWIVDEIRINPDPRLTPLFQGRDLSAITTINAGSVTLQNLTKEDVLELLALQFFVRARPA